MSEKQQQRQYVDCTTALDVTMSCASCSKPTMGEKQKVLIAMDGSEHSFSAFDWFIDNWRKDGVEIVIAHVAEYNSLRHAPELTETVQIECLAQGHNVLSQPLIEQSFFASGFYLAAVNQQRAIMSSDPATIKRIIQEEEDEVNIIVNKIGNRLSRCERKGKLLRLNGEVGHSIVKAAHAEKANLIVTGTRGLGMFRRTLLGSVSDYVLHHAHIPVLICRHDNSH